MLVLTLTFVAVLISGRPTIISKPTSGPGSDRRDPEPVGSKADRGGSPVVLNCAADADPPASYAWTRRETRGSTSREPVVDGGAYKLFSNGSLQITPNTLLVGGLYGLMAIASILRVLFNILMYNLQSIPVHINSAIKLHFIRFTCNASNTHGADIINYNVSIHGT